MRVAIVAMGPTNRQFFDEIYYKPTKEQHCRGIYDKFVNVLEDYSEYVQQNQEAITKILEATEKIADKMPVGQEYDEVWAINGMGAILRNYDKLFHMDDLDLCHFEIDPEMPVITSSMKEGLNTELYPIDEHYQKLGRLYLNNTVAYAICYAILKEVKEINLFGCDFVPHQGMDAKITDSGASCCEYWIREAENAGMLVNVANTSRLLGNDTDGALYGYAEQPIISSPNGKFTHKNGQWVYVGR